MMVDRSRASVAASPPALPRARTSALLLAAPNLSTANLVKNQQLTYCLRLVKDMLRLKDAFGFSKPIDRLWSRDQLPGYFEMISNPMDLGTIKHRLEAGSYLIPTPGGGSDDATFDADAFSADMRLVFSNARTYNRQGDIFYEAATRLSDKFDTRFAQMPTKFEANTANQSKSKSKKRKKSGGAPLAAGERKKNGDNSRRKKVATVAKKRGAAAAATPNTAPAVLDDDSVNEDVAMAGTAKKSTPKSRKSTKTKAASGAVDGGGKAKKALPKLARKSLEEMTTDELYIRIRRIEVRQSAPTAAASNLYAMQAKALYDVEMTYDEKVQLSNNVSDLHADKLAKLFALASKNTAVEVNNNEEVELYIDGLPNKTLRDMEALVLQALTSSRKGANHTPPPNGDIIRMSATELDDELLRLRAVYNKRTKVNGRKVSEEGGTAKKSLYESDSSSDSDDSSASSSSSDDDDDSSSSDDSDSSADQVSPETMRKRRERNLAHQQAMQAAGTPLQSPGYR